jgi:hypothetical protein
VVRGQTEEEWVRVKFGREGILDVRIKTGERIKVSKARDGLRGGRGCGVRISLRNRGYVRFRTGLNEDGDEGNGPRDS